jgi:hypothetical protein
MSKKKEENPESETIAFKEEPLKEEEKDEEKLTKEEIKKEKIIHLQERRGKHSTA